MAENANGQIMPMTQWKCNWVLSRRQWDIFRKPSVLDYWVIPFLYSDACRSKMEDSHTGQYWASQTIHFPYFPVYKGGNSVLIMTLQSSTSHQLQQGIPIIMLKKEPISSVTYFPFSTGLFSNILVILHHVTREKSVKISLQRMHQNFSLLRSFKFSPSNSVSLRSHGLLISANSEQYSSANNFNHFLKGDCNSCCCTALSSRPGIFTEQEEITRVLATRLSTPQKLCFFSTLVEKK